MATATKPNGVTKPADASTALVERETTFVPFMGKDEIRLSVSIVKNLICVKTRNGRVCDDREAIRFIMLCKARGLNPFEGDAYLTGYENNDGTATFSLITSHQALLKRAETHPEYDGMESGAMVLTEDKRLVDREGDFILDTDTLVGAWATVFFKTRSHPMKKRLKLSTFSTGKSRWNKDPAGMIVKCAEGDALRSSFPNTLGGMYLEDELDGMVENLPAPAKGSKRVSRSPLNDQLAIGTAAPAAEPELESIDATSHDAPELDEGGHADDFDEHDRANNPLVAMFEKLRFHLASTANEPDVQANRKWAIAEAKRLNADEEVFMEIDTLCGDRGGVLAAAEEAKKKAKTTQKELP